MKSVLANPEALVYCVRIVTVNGTIFRFVSYAHDLIMSNGAIYKTDLGYEPTDLVIETNTTGSLWDLEGFFEIAGIDRDQLKSGLMDNARVYLFATSWAVPIEDEEPATKGIMGKASIRDGRYTIEVMGLIDTMNQSVGRTFGPLCDWTLFDETLDGDVIPYERSRCTGPRAAQDGPLIATYKVTGTVTSVTSQKIWTDSARAEAAVYFDYGFVKWTSGDNAGLPSQPIKAHAAGGVITQYHSAHYPIQIGDAYEMIPGCNKKKSGDCVTKFSNGINNGGFEDMAPPESYKEFGGNG